MTIRTPRLAILGAGPIGLEAALAAAESGLDFVVYEAGPAVADHLRQWGHVRLFSPWDLDVSPRVRRHLQQLGCAPPSGSECPTGRELLETALMPLARSPAIAPTLRLDTRVLAVGREGLLKHEAIGERRRADHRFRLLLRGRDAREWTETADVVIDCTGNYGHPNPLGDGGIPAPGERSLGVDIIRTIPDIAADSGAWAGRRTLLAGAGHSAQTAAVALARLAAERPGTEVVWALRRPEPVWEILPNDPLPARAALGRRAQDLARGASPSVRAVFGVVVDSLEPRRGRVAVTLRGVGGDSSSVTVDKVLSLTGFVGDFRLYRQLQVHECWATSGPIKLAASLLSSASSDCLALASHGVDTLVNPEPNFFMLGAKSYGRNSTFLMKVGWQQVEEVFGLLAPS